ncbi:unnamed protein product [Amoebophrya sp. A120]|nr:unnamed protein product [Amoebophrya sp. A120]|eukprot:GSA120T00015878001.1
MVVFYELQHQNVPGRGCKRPATHGRTLARTGATSENKSDDADTTGADQKIASATSAGTSTQEEEGGNEQQLAPVEGMTTTTTATITTPKAANSTAALATTTSTTACFLSPARATPKAHRGSNFFRVHHSARRAYLVKSITKDDFRISYPDKENYHSKEKMMARKKVLEEQNQQLLTSMKLSKQNPRTMMLRNNPEDGDPDVHTWMIRDLPCRFRQEELRSILDYEFGLENKYNFFYLPMDVRLRNKKAANRGYGFLNLVDKKDSALLKAALHGKRLPGSESKKCCHLQPAKIQGLFANLLFYKGQFYNSNYNAANWNYSTNGNGSYSNGANANGFFNNTGTAGTGTSSTSNNANTSSSTGSSCNNYSNYHQHQNHPNQHQVISNKIPTVKIPFVSSFLELQLCLEQLNQMEISFGSCGVEVKEREADETTTVDEINEDISSTTNGVKSKAGNQKSDGAAEDTARGDEDVSAKASDDQNSSPNEERKMTDGEICTSKNYEPKTTNKTNESDLGLLLEGRTIAFLPAFEMKLFMSSSSSRPLMQLQTRREALLAQS